MKIPFSDMPVLENIYKYFNASNRLGYTAMPGYDLHRFTSVGFNNALTDLSKQIGKSKNLSKVVPIRIMSTGGFVSVMHLGNRTATGDLDYILDPKVTEKLWDKLWFATYITTQRKKLGSFWFSSNISVFVVGDERGALFQKSIDQEIILWQSKNLIVYACQWEWSLDRKLKRLSQFPRSVDLADAVYILKKIVELKGGPLERAEIRGWYAEEKEPILDSVLDALAANYQLYFAMTGVVTVDKVAE